MSFKIRNVREDDFLEIASLSHKCLPMVSERNSIYHIFTKFFQNTCLVVENESKSIIGFLIGFISQTNSEDAYIHLLCVDPSFRRKKIASLLIEEYLKIVSDFGCLRIYLITSSTNNVSQSFYKNFGFLPVENEKTFKMDGISVVKDYNGPGDHKVLFCLEISQFHKAFK